MTALTRRRRPPLAPALVIAGALAIAVGAQLVAALAHAGPTAAPAVAPAAVGPLLDPAAVAPAADGLSPNEELARARADVDFWAARVQAHAFDIVAAVKLAESDLVEARLTGDVTAYLRARDAVNIALKAQPAYLPAKDLGATILVSLHRFPDALAQGQSILAASPGDATALGVIGDASLELGDVTTAGKAYAALARVADGSASRVRAGHLAFVAGDSVTALADTRAAVQAATDEALEGSALGFYEVTLGEMLIATGDPAEARSAYGAALAASPDLPAALVGLAKLDAFAGDTDRAIAELSTAAAAIPLPDTLARRADLYQLRGAPGDAARATADRATVQAIAKLAGDAAYVYDRGQSLFLSDHGLDPGRAVSLAEHELAVRKDVYGYDALAWALLNAGRGAEADVPMQAALAFGTRDARLWYHAGLIAAADGRPAEARTDLAQALALGPALDPLSRRRATTAMAALP